MASTTRTDAPAQAPETKPEGPEKKASGRERLRYLLRRPKLWLTALILLALAAAVMAGSLGVFTSSSVNANNEVSSGTLSQTNSGNEAILTALDMLPGETRTGTVTIKNTGTTTGIFTLSDSNLVDTPGPHGGQLSAVLDLTVRDDTRNVQLYTGKFNAFPSPPDDIPLPGTGTGPPTNWQPDEQHTFTFSVTFPEGGQPSSPTTGDNAYQGSKVTVTYNWDAISG